MSISVNSDASGIGSPVLLITTSKKTDFFKRWRHFETSYFFVSLRLRFQRFQSLKGSNKSQMSQYSRTKQTQRTKRSRIWSQRTRKVFGLRTSWTHPQPRKISMTIMTIMIIMTVMTMTHATNKHTEVL